MIPIKTFEEYLRRTAPAWDQYLKDIMRKRSVSSHHLTPYAKFRRAIKPHMDWLLAEVVRLRGE